MTDDSIELSIILPSLNEARSLETLLPELTQAFPEAEIIVVDDGSKDDTANICDRSGCQRVVNPYRMGNGAAIKRGARAARGMNLAMIDADGQHTAGHLSKLWQRFQSADFDMLVGARHLLARSIGAVAGYGLGLFRLAFPDDPFLRGMRGTLTAFHAAVRLLGLA